MSDEEEGERTYQIIFEEEPAQVYKFLPPKDGKAKASWPNGDTFEGTYKEGKRTGKGIYKLSSGASYDGDYIENKKEGFGIYGSPDGGKYTGEWLNDKRHGQGTYKYPSGDSYTGEWKNGAKHGRGSYLYKGGNTSITGVWSNGQVVDGSWTSHDGGKYMGAFLDNSPAGEGVYVHSNGNTAGGLYADGLFKADSFKRPHPNEKPPEPREVDLFKKACRAIDKSVTMVDHYNTMFRLKPEHDGVPNFRRVGQTVVFGSAQPTVKGLKKLAEVLGEAGVDKTNWVSLREDPVLYIAGQPLCPRDRRNMGRSLVLAGIDNKMMIELENRLSDNIKFLIKKKGNLHDYFEDFYEPVDGTKTTNKKTLAVKGPEDIKTITSLYQFLAEEEDTPVAYSRVSMNESGSPSVAQFDAFHQTVRKNDGSSMVFHDADGGDRVTTAQMLALLILNQENASAGDEGEEEAGDGEGDEGDKKEKVEVAEYNADEPNFNLGQYSSIMKLISALNGEETEEDKAKREQDEEAAKEIKVNEAIKAYDEEQRIKEEAELAAKAAAEAAAEGAEGDEAAEKPAEGDAPAEGEGDEAAPAEDAGPAEKTLDERIEEAKASVPCGPPVVTTVGTDAKKRVDTALEKAGSAGNLLVQILDLKKEYDDKQEATTLMSAKVKMESYINALLFTAFLKDFAAAPPADEPAEEEEGDGEAKAPTGLTFSKWRGENNSLVSLLGTVTSGELSEFLWD